MSDGMKTSLTLKSGYEMPVLGLGTWELKGEECEETVRTALELGYRHIDTAELYENEEQIGKVLGDFEREEVFLTSKVPHEKLRADDMMKACDASLKKLQTEYLDLYLAHWPNDDIPVEEMCKGLEQLVLAGKVRSVGLSNFDVERMKDVIMVTGVPMSNLQIEYHPFTKRDDLPEFCRSQHITVTAYSPLARGKVFDEPIIKEIADKHEKSAAQVTLRWLVQKGNIVIPKASSEEHLRDNMDIFDWELSAEEINNIDTMPEAERLIDKTYT